MNLDDFHARCDEIGECWEWRARQTKEHGRRYPQIRVQGKTYNVRRAIYEAKHGEVRQGLFVVPTCGNLYCVNPDHCKAMTESQKSRHAAKRGAFSSLTRSRSIAVARRKAAYGKLDIDRAREIRLSDEPGPVLAQKYGIDKSLVNRIKRGEAWKDYDSVYWRLGA